MEIPVPKEEIPIDMNKYGRLCQFKQPCGTIKIKLADEGNFISNN